MIEQYSGATRLVVILGDPIAQVKAPGGLTREFERRSTDAVVVPMQVRPADIKSVLSAIDRIANIDGIIATIPHKFALAEHCTGLSDRSAFLGVANVARREADGWSGDMLDGEAFVDAILSAGCRLTGEPGLLVGAGGAGSAIGLSLLDRGIGRLAISDIDAGRREALMSKLDRRYGDKIVEGSSDPRGYSLVVNATPLGMSTDDPLPLDSSGLSPTIFVGDVITKPEVTPLLQRARELGCNTQTGVGMFESSVSLMADFFAPSIGASR
ncbi:Shikimate dehydrogenase (NADP(+)) [Bradyrhizobium ivorense]|uniref:Shikimate dehydrogenase (NADP(+)) n=1 Tax=Bradyrhizobium ivorense TaxID=2511166 RepID=A0A508TCF0_9BRAD|nr:shikimate dehydrogenase [Bradyrhizobium ivorense]VIO71554.1 Shikimate dehydrogenase (NADP(+)) [Bradyrhizobium ivorense]